MSYFPHYTATVVYTVSLLVAIANTFAVIVPELAIVMVPLLVVTVNAETAETVHTLVVPDELVLKV